MMEFFYEKKDVFQLKELEKLCQKEKGITSMTVKEVLQSLVDDGLVDTDKIGTSIYYWAFPSKASQKRKRKIEELQKSIEEAKAKKLALADMIKQTSMGREDTADRQSILAQVEERNAEKAALLAKLKQYEECDPEALEMMKQQAKAATEAANRWTDNIFAVKSWIKNKFNFDEATINKQFSIPEDLDYVS